MAEKTIQTEQGVPPWLNILMKFILRSPLHGLVSSSIMLISFTGRKSGRQYTTPVSYMQIDDGVALFTHAPWWHNLAGGVPVTLRLKGKTLSAKAEAIIQDQTAVAEGLMIHLLHNHIDAKYYHVTYDAAGKPNPDEVRRGAAGVVMVKFRLA